MALLKVDAQGTIDASRWFSECERFVGEVIWPALTEEEARALARASLAELTAPLLGKPAGQGRAAALLLDLLEPANDALADPAFGEAPRPGRDRPEVR